MTMKSNNSKKEAAGGHQRRLSSLKGVMTPTRTVSCGRQQRRRSSLFHHYSYSSWTLLVVVVLWCVLLQKNDVLVAANQNTLAATATTCVPHSLMVPNNNNKAAVVQKQRHRRQLIIAHRGASYHLPEHTLPAYRLALELGADYIEPDLVASSDGVLMALHTLDLNITTDVEAVFGSTRPPWFSPTANRSGYWTFNFTADEMQTLRVQQRLPAARTTALDGQWRIPRLEEILQVLSVWNQKDLPQTMSVPTNVTASPTSNTTTVGPERKPTPLELAQAGIYVEFKEPVWLQQEAGLDTVQLLYQHFETYRHLWKDLIEVCYSSVRYDQYVLPKLVVQSFDATALQSFYQQWPLHYSNQIPEDGNNNNNAAATLPSAPRPPSVLLVNKRDCTAEEFWHRVGTTWRPFVDGVGCDKTCLLASDDVKDRALELNLALHPWTERPEQVYVTSQFDSALQETLYLFCQVGVHGIFTESVSIAVMAAQLGCSNFDQEEKDGPERREPTAAPNGNNKDDEEEKHGSSVLCYESEQEASFYTGLASFIMGIFVASFVSVWLHRKRRRGRQRYRVGASVVPTAEEMDGAVPTDVELELT